MLDNGQHPVADGKLAMAFTHLEMCAAPALPNATLPAGLQFHSLDVSPDSYRDLYRRVGQDWMWYNRLTYSDAKLSEHFAKPEVALYTLSRNGKPEAILELNFQKPDEVELAYFGLTAELIGQGAGRYLMTQALRLGWERPIKRMFLQTCNYDSPQALGFYMRSGFVPYKRVIEIDDDPRLSGILPLTAAPHVPLIRP